MQHPFVDGNGRTSRLLSTVMLYRAGYDFKSLFTLSEFYDRARPAFYRALQSVREQEMDLTPWLTFFANGLATQLTEVKERGEIIIRAFLIEQTYKLSERQGSVLRHLMLNGPTGMAEFESLRPDVNRRTLQRDLKLLVEKKLVTESGSGPTEKTRKYIFIRT